MSGSHQVKTPPPGTDSALQSSFLSCSLVSFSLLSLAICADAQVVPFKCLCRPPPASGAPRAALYPVAETMAGFRGAAPKGWQPRVGRTCVCYGARVPTPAGKLSFLVFEPTRRDPKEPRRCKASHPSLQTVRWKKQGNWWPSARGFVVGPQITERGRNQGDPSPTTKTQAPPAQRWPARSEGD